MQERLFVAVYMLRVDQIECRAGFKLLLLKYIWNEFSNVLEYGCFRNYLYKREREHGSNSILS